MAQYDYIDQRYKKTSNLQDIIDRQKALESKYQQEQKAKEEQANAPWYEKAWDTVVDVGGNLVGGFLRFGEGIVDLGATIAGGIGGMFGADTQWAEDFVKYDWTGETYMPLVNDATNNSVLGGTAEAVIQGVGQMLPGITVTALTGGATAGAVLPSLIASSAGTGTQDALNDGANFGNAIAYGVTTGALEGVMEKITGGASRIASVGGKTAVKGIAKNVVKEGLSEAFEEGTQAVLDPLVQTIYKGKEGLEGYSDPNFFKNVGQSALVGGLSGGIVQGIGQGINITKAGGVNEFKAHDYETQKHEIDTQMEELEAQGKLTDDIRQNMLNTKTELDNRINESVSKLDITKQKAFFENKEAFNLSTDFIFDEKEGLKRKQKTAEIDDRYYSHSLLGNESTIVENLKKQGTSVFNGQLNEQEQKNFARLKNVQRALSEKGLVGSNFVLAETSDKFHSYIDKNTIVYGKDVLESDVWQQKVIHEIEHFTEGTKEWADYAQFVLNNTDTSTAIESVLKKGYGISQSDVETLNESLSSGKLTEKQKLLVSEIMATQSETLFGNEQMIKKLTSENKTLASKIADKIKKFISVLKAKTPEEKQLIQMLSKAQKLFESALKNAGNVNSTKTAKPKFSIKEINGKKIVVIDTDQHIFDGVRKEDFAGVVKQYMRDNFRGKIINGVEFNAVSENEYTYSKDTNRISNKKPELYDSKMRAVTELNNIIQTGKFIGHEQAKHPHNYNTNGYNRYSVQFVMDNKLLTGEMLVALGKNKNIFYDIVKIKESNSAIETNSKVAESLSSINKILQTNKKVNSLNESGQNNTKFSLKDSKGRLLTAEQVEYFKDSKVRDSEGNLLEVYHGTNSNHNVFDTSRESRFAKERTSNAIYFTSKKEVAEFFAKKRTVKEFMRLNYEQRELGRIIQSYINIEKPLIIDAQQKQIDEVIMASEIREIKQNKFYDGIIVKNVVDGLETQSSDIYIVFNSNQAKLTTNLNPTSNDDIRFSKKAPEKKPRKYVARNTKLNEQLTEKEKILQLKQNIHDRALEFKDIKKRTYEPSSLLSRPEMKAFIGEFSKWVWKNGLDKQKVYGCIEEFSKFYNKKNELLYDKDNEAYNYIDENVMNDIEFMNENFSKWSNQSQGLLSGEFKLEELKALERIQLAMLHLYKNFDTVIYKNQKTAVAELSAEGLSQLEKGGDRVKRSGFGRKLFDFTRNIGDPLSTVRYLDNYNEGVLTNLFYEIQDGETKSKKVMMVITEDIDKFLKVNKGFAKHLANDKIMFKGENITIDEAMQLYLTGRREQAKLGLKEAGISLSRNGTTVTIKHITEADIDDLYKSFSDKEKEFIALSKDFFNVKARAVKEQADYKMLGYSNVGESDDYIPIRRSGQTIARNMSDARANMADYQNIHNFSFNKATKKNAKNEIFIGGLYNVIQTHAYQTGIYAGLSTPLKNFNLVYNKNLGSGSNDVVSIRQFLNRKVWDGTDSYIRNLLQDVQSNARQNNNKILSFLRSNYSKYQLGANPKVILSQFASFPTAGIYLDTGCISKALTMKTNFKLMDKYCDYANIRAFEKAIVKAESVSDKVGKVGDVLTKPIQLMDRFTIGKLWNACQLQVKKDKGIALNTEENYKEASVLLEKVIRETQPNYVASERSALMRSPSDLVRGITMFTSVPLKQLSRLFDAVGEFNSIKHMIKNGDSTTETQTRFKLAKKKLGRSFASILCANIMYVLLGLAVKWLFNRQDKDKKGNPESFVKVFFNDLAGTYTGMIPIVRDVYGYFSNGYELDNYALSMVNDLTGATKSTVSMLGKLFSGEDVTKQEIFKPLRQLLYGTGQMTGIPTRNLNNYISGLVGKFSPETAEKYNNLFYSTKSSTTKTVVKDNVLEKIINPKIIEEVKNFYKENKKQSDIAKHIQGLPLRKEQKYILLGSLGYGVSKLQIINIRTYLQSQKLSKEEKQELFNMCC